MLTAKWNKKILSFIVASALLFTILPLPAPAYAASAPQTESVDIVNPGFEEVDSSTGLPIGWSRWSGSSAGFNGMTVSDSVYNGDSGKSLRLEVPVDTAYGVTSSMFPVTPGDTYTVTSSVYVESINAGVTASYVSLYIYYYKENGSFDSSTVRNLSASSLELKKWFDLSFDSEVPVTATKAQILINVNKATESVTYYDDFRVIHHIPEVNEGRPVNGSFDAPLNADSSIRGWKATPAIGDNNNYAVLSTEYYKSAPNSLKLYDNSAASTVITSSKFEVSPGNSYSLSLEGRHGTGTSPWVYWYFYDKDGKQLDKNGAIGNLYTSVASGTLGMTDTTQFKKIAPTAFTNIVAPKGAVTSAIAIQFGGGATGTSYIDDVVISEKRVLQNGDFEKASVNSSIPNWSYFASMDANQSIVLSAEHTYLDSATSVKFVDNSPASMGIISDSIDIEGGKTYGVTLKAYIVKEQLEKSGTAQVYLYFYDADGKQISATSKNTSTPTDKWTELYLEAVAPSNTATAKVMLYSGGATVGTVYYDDILFEEVAVISLPTAFGAPVSLGDATIVSKTQGAAVGNGEIYFGTNGSPAAFNAVDAFTGEVNFTQSLPGEDVVWAVTIGSDNNVYVAGTQTGNLYRYNPSQKKLDNLGKNPSNKWVWDLDASEDGKIYGSTYADGNGKAFVYDIASNTFADIGTPLPGQDYVRGGGISGDYFYAGIGTTAHLFRYNRHTLEKTEIMLPITGTSTSISNVYAYNGKLFVVYGTSLIIMNEDDHKILQTINWQSSNAFDGIISTPSPYNSDLVYFRNKNTSKLWTYNTATNEFVIAEDSLTLPNLSTKAMDWVELQDGPHAGRQVLLIMTNEINVTLYDPIDRTITTYNPQVSGVGIDIQSLETGPDGNLYMGGYQGAMSVYDTQLGEFIVQEKEPHQIEGIGFINGKAYFGIYGGAIIYEYDATKPFQMGVNPKIIHDIQSGQSRPFTFTSGEDKLFIGTIADYGILGGGLTVYDSVAGTWKEHRKGFEELSVIGLAYKDGKVYGGTSLWGGLGIEITATEAFLFEWDVAAEKMTYSGKPAIASFTPQMIGELSIGPDGNLWGIMWGQTPTSESSFALFSMNPDTKEIISSRIMNTGARASTWRPFFMRWGDDGILYTTLGRELYAFDPATLASVKLVNDYVHLMTLGPDGSIYYASGAKLMKIPVRMNGASLTASGTEVAVGEALDLNVRLSLTNGKIGNADGTLIQYTLSDPAVAEVRDGKLYGLRKGNVTVTAKVAQDTAHAETNSIQVSVNPASVFHIAEMKFTDWNNNVITELQPNSIVQARVSVSNNRDTAQEAVLIVALYDNLGQMVNVSLLSREFAAGAEDTIQAGFRLPDEVDGYTIRAMVWDNVYDMQPLAPALSLE